MSTIIVKITSAAQNARPNLLKIVFVHTLLHELSNSSYIRNFYHCNKYLCTNIVCLKLVLFFGNKLFIYLPQSVPKQLRQFRLKKSVRCD